MFFFLGGWRGGRGKTVDILVVCKQLVVAIHISSEILLFTHLNTDNLGEKETQLILQAQASSCPSATSVRMVCGTGQGSGRDSSKMQSTTFAPFLLHPHMSHTRSSENVTKYIHAMQRKYYKAKTIIQTMPTSL